MSERSHRRARGPGRLSRLCGLAVVFVFAASSTARAQQAGPSEWTTPSQFSPPPLVEPPPPPPAPPPPQAAPAPASSPPLGMPAPAPAVPVAAPEATQPGYRTTFTLMPGLGVATFAVSDAWVGWGAVLEGTGEVRFNPWVGLRIRLAWGLTEWDRSALMIDHGIAAGAWTAQAFSSVGTWLVNPPTYFLLKLFPSLFAFLFLTMGFLYSGMVFLLSPLAATSYLQLGLSASGHLPLDNGVDLFIEGGLGAMTYWHPRTQYVRMAFGPVFGLGLAVRRISFGLYGMWSPPVMQSSPSGAPDVFAASLSLRYAY
jgi:hypothetical protein